MKLSAAQRQAIATYLEAPAEPQHRQGLHGLFWSSLMNAIAEEVNGGRDLKGLFTDSFDFINFGLCPGASAEAAARGSDLKNAAVAYPFCQIKLFTEWLDEIVKKVNKGDQKESLERDIKLARISIKHLEDEIKMQQESRAELLLKNYGENGKPPPPPVVKQIESMEATDTGVLESMRVKRSISRGVFFSVEQKRQHIQLETQLQKEIGRNDGLIAKIKSKEDGLTVKNSGAKIAEIITQLLDTEEAIGKRTQALSDIQKRQESLSAVEIESRIRTEIEYVRDLLMLAAKRLHQDSCPFLRPDEPCFTVKEIGACVDRILEFDPRIFYNDRASIFGRPGIVLVPGSGNALFDWKNNMIIVPLIPPAGNCMASIATAMIEYRLDVDEEKRLMTSYNQIPDYKDLRSIFQLRATMTHDYIAWMLSEYKGYRVLGKDTKKWFDHEIAPDRNDIFAPPDYQQFALSSADYKKRAEDLEAALAGNLDECTVEVLWHGSIVAYQNGKFPRAIELLRQLVKKSPEHTFAYYNLGHACMKTMQKQEAIAAFMEFAKRNGQSWWAAIARDHVLHLQRG
ncbi:MAG: hypothetical protein PHC61_03235 [Chitinivibrionales bacterium]|nr:hypothetical protein [Chitinivibrionales bacterium]